MVQHRPSIEGHGVESGNATLEVRHVEGQPKVARIARGDEAVAAGVQLLTAHAQHRGVEQRHVDERLRDVRTGAIEGKVQRLAVGFRRPVELHEDSEPLCGAQIGMQEHSLTERRIALESRPEEEIGGVVILRLEAIFGPKSQPHRSRSVEWQIAQPLERAEGGRPPAEIAAVLLPSKQLDRAGILRGERAAQSERGRAREQRDQQGSAT